MVKQSALDTEIDKYFNEPFLGLDQDPITWWRQNHSQFKLLSVLAQKCLAPPPTSVASERLFSTAGDICTDSRSRLLPDKAEQLIFLKINLPLLNFVVE